MELIAKIQRAGFTIALDGEKIRVEYAGEGDPPEAAKALLDTLRERKGEAIAYLKETMPRPYFGPDGDIVIPFNSDPKYFYWQSGQSTEKTIEELKSWVH